MKPSLLILALILVGAVDARADLTIVQKIEGGEGTNKVTLKVKGDKARVEVNPQITTIMDSKSGDLTTLFNDQKKVMRISGEKAKAMAEMAKAMMKGNSEASPPKPSGRKETINGYMTEEYVSDSSKLHTSYWVAKSYPNYQSILQQMAVLQNGAFAAMRKGFPNYHDLPGLPLRTVIKPEGEAGITSTIESVNDTSLPASDFTVPADYSEMKMPDFLGGKQSPGKPSDGE